MKKQFWLTVVILLAAIVYLRFFTTIEAVPLPADIENFPRQIGTYSMISSSELSEGVLRELGVSSYINRDYRNKDGHQLALYLGYFEEQREGSQIHSPMHCMPGSGWNPVETAVVPISLPGSDKSYKVNRILFQKGMDKLIMYYWFQGRHRVIANEYADRFFLLMDSLLKHRSEGALVRVTGPWDPSGENDIRQKKFIADLFPILREHLPK